MLVNNDAESLVVVSSSDLKVKHTLALKGQTAFCACIVGKYLYVGCNKGEVVIYNLKKDFEFVNHIKLGAGEKVSQMHLLVNQ